MTLIPKSGFYMGYGFIELKNKPNGLKAIIFNLKRQKIATLIYLWGGGTINQFERFFFSKQEENEITSLLDEKSPVLEKIKKIVEFCYENRKEDLK